MLTLEDLSGRIPEQHFDRGRVTLGRHPDNTVALEGYTMVSGHHAAVSEENGQWVLEDLGSTNGTFCNGLRIHPGTRTVLKSGDVIQLGTHGPMFKVSFSVGPVPVVRLRHLSPGHRGKIEVVPGGSTTVGSGGQADIRWADPGFPAIAPIHARFSVTPSRVVVEDLSGGPGILVNGRPVRSAELHHRDRVAFGPNGVEVEVEILAVPTTDATVAYLLPEKEASPQALQNANRPGFERTDAGGFFEESGPSTASPRGTQPVRGAGAAPSAVAAGVPEPRSWGVPGPAAPPPAVSPEPVRDPGARALETVGARLESWRDRVRRRVTSAEGDQGTDRAGESSRRALILRVVLLLVLLVITCVLGIALSITVTRRQAGAAVEVTTAVHVLARGDDRFIIDQDRGGPLRKDLDSVLVELGVVRRRVGDEEVQAIERFLEAMKPWSPLRRAAPYLPEIRRVLDQYDVPAPFMYLPWVESHFDPAARSSAGAVGLWQFVAHTGRRYRMRTASGAADQRRDWVRETVAAAQYLHTLLHLEVPGWDPLLALAAYNRGEEKIIADLETLRASLGPPPAPDADAESLYWILRRTDLLPEETRDYVPRFLAAAVYFVFPEHYP